MTKTPDDILDDATGVPTDAGVAIVRNWIREGGDAQAFSLAAACRLDDAEVRALIEELGRPWTEGETDDDDDTE